MKGGKITMDKKITFGILALGILLMGLYIFQNYEGAFVSAQGQSIIEVQPDKISININIDQKGNTAQEVKDKMKEISDKTVLNLLAAGVDKKDMELQNYNIYPDYEWTQQGGNKQKGFRGNQQIIVKTSNFEIVPKVVDAAIDSGSLISFINFELSNEKENEYKAKALEAAGKDARNKAEATAAGLSKKIGKLISVESSNFEYGGPWAYYAKNEGLATADAGAEARQAAISINPKTTEVSASVTVKYKLSSFS